MPCSAVRTCALRRDQPIMRRRPLPDEALLGGSSAGLRPGGVVLHIRARGGSDIGFWFAVGRLACFIALLSPCSSPPPPLFLPVHRPFRSPLAASTRFAPRRSPRPPSCGSSRFLARAVRQPRYHPDVVQSFATSPYRSWRSTWRSCCCCSKFSWSESGRPTWRLEELPKSANDVFAYRVFSGGGC